MNFLGKLKKNSILILNDKAFTLVELMLVLSILGLIMLVAYPAFKSVKGDNALYSEARKIMVDLRYMQQLSVNEQVDYNLTFDSNGEGYSITAGTETFKTVSLTSGVIFDAANSEGIFSNTCTINKDGYTEGVLPGEYKKIALSNSSDKFIYVYIRAAGKAEVSWN